MRRGKANHQSMKFQLPRDTLSANC